MWPKKVALLTAASILFARNVYGADCEKDSFRLEGQTDADALSDCPTLTGDVVIAATAEGSIDLKGVETIRDSNQSLLEGNFEDWEECRGLDSLHAQDLVHVTGDVSLRSLLDITNVDLRNLEAINGTLSAEYLPHVERMNFSSLEMVESVFVRHNRQLVNLTMSDIKNVSGENPIIEMVDLGIYEWPKIKVRYHYWDEKPRRRLEKLLVKDLPNVSLFELNNADEIDLLKPAVPVPGDPFTEPIVLVHNFTMVGFGGDFEIIFQTYTPSDVTIEVRNLHFVENTMDRIELWRIGKPQSMHIANNRELTHLSMPQDMQNANWEAIEFHNNPRLCFGGEDLDGWDWSLEARTVSIKGSPVSMDWVEYGMSGRIKQSLIIDPSEKSDEVCELVQEHVKEGEFSAPENGYSCGGENYDSESAAVERATSSAALMAVACVTGLMGTGWAL